MKCHSIGRGNVYQQGSSTIVSLPTSSSSSSLSATQLAIANYYDNRYHFLKSLSLLSYSSPSTPIKLSPLLSTPFVNVIVNCPQFCCYHLLSPLIVSKSITIGIVIVSIIFNIIIIIIVIIIKITISSHLIGSFNTLFFHNLTEKSFIGECSITKCCFWTPVIGQLNKPITARGFLTNQQQKIVTLTTSYQLCETVTKTKQRGFTIAATVFFKRETTDLFIFSFVFGNCNFYIRFVIGPSGVQF